MKNILILAICLAAVGAQGQVKKDSLAHAAWLKWEADSSSVETEIRAHRSAIERYKSEPDSYFANLTKMWNGKKVFTRESMIADEERQIDATKQKLVRYHEEYTAALAASK